jgi:hypothetical protein
MTKLLRMTSLAAVAAAALAATPAAAQQVGPSDRNATATARIIKPLTLAWAQDLNLGTIMLTGPAGFTGEVVGITAGGAFTCSGVNVTCSGTPQVARYVVTGTQGQNVTINAGDVTMTNGFDATQTLLLKVDNPGNVTLANSGTPGTPFALGGSITLNSTTRDGTYTGTFNVTVNY